MIKLMRNNILFLLILVISVPSFGTGADIQKGWYWKFEGSKQLGDDHITITYVPASASFSINGTATPPVRTGPNFCDALVGSQNIVQWHDVFGFSAGLASGEIPDSDLSPFTILGNDPLFSLHLSGPVEFSLDKVADPQQSGLRNYKKVVYTSKVGVTICIYLQSLGDNLYRVSGIFIKNQEVKYSYRDFSFTNYWSGDGGGGAGAGAVVQTLLHRNSTGVYLRKIESSQDLLVNKLLRLFMDSRELVQ